jgi:hypothetical protein
MALVIGITSRLLGRFTPGERTRSMFWIGACAGLRAVLNAMKNRKYCGPPIVQTIF